MYIVDSLKYLVKIGIQTLSIFCVDGETILSGCWPPEDWNFRWLNKIKVRGGCVFPLLLLDQDNVQEDFTVLATYITLEQVNKKFSRENGSSQSRSYRSRLGVQICPVAIQNILLLTRIRWEMESICLLSFQPREFVKIIKTSQVLNSMLRLI